MSHQDLMRKSASETHAAELYKVFQWLVPARCFDSIRFRDDCSWSPRLLAFAALLWCWSDYSKLGQRFRQVLKIIGGLFKKQHVPQVSYQAFVTLLGRWTGPLLECLFRAYRSKLQTSLSECWRIRRWVVFAVDGSKVLVPRTRRNEERYSPRSKLSRKSQRRKTQRCKTRCRRQRAREKQANVPQIFLTVLWHVASGLPWDWRLGPADSSERDHFRDMLRDMPPDALLAADAGFVGYDLWSAILQQGSQLLIRVGQNVRLLKHLGYVKQDRDLVYLWPAEAMRKNRPPLVLRLIVLNTGKHPVYLVTGLTARELSDAQACEIYRQRWGIEVFYRHCKQTFDRAKLRSKNPDNAHTEMQWSLMAMAVMGLYSHAQLTRRGVPPSKISFVGVLDAFRHAIREHRWRPAEGERLDELIGKAIIDDYIRASKASRDYPQQKQHRPPAPPTILTATNEQRRKAQQFQEITKKRLTA